MEEGSRSIRRRTEEVRKQRRNQSSISKSSKRKAKLGFELDSWQRIILEQEGRNLCLCTGRQIGKSTCIGFGVVEFVVKNPGKKVMVISLTERQAYWLFEKIYSYLFDNYRDLIKKGKDKPTKRQIKLKNGSELYCYPTGLYGHGIRGKDIDLLVADEAAFIPEEVWASITPALITKECRIWLLSTPYGKQGYFYERYIDEDFFSFHISTREVAERRPEPMRTIMLDNLKREAKRLTALQFAQEYEGEFIQELKQFFPDALIRDCMSAQKGMITRKGLYYLGADIAAEGGDETVLTIFEKVGDVMEQRECIIRKQALSYTIKEIMNLDRLYNFRKIYIDDGGLGVGVFDFLLNQTQTRRKVEAINNSKRSITYDVDNPRRIRILKEDLYINTKRLMEMGKIKLLNFDEILHSFKSVQIEKNPETLRTKIGGTYTHIVEAVIRAVWGEREKNLYMWIRWS